MLISDDYYPAIAQPNVEVVTDGIAEVTPTGIVTEDGVKHEVDTIIYGTGFRVTDLPVMDMVHGRDGVSLREAWSDGMEAHLGTAVSGFPNFFLLIGPNTGLGHSSMVFMIESQIAYIVDASEDDGRGGAAAGRGAAGGAARVRRRRPVVDAQHGLDPRRLHQLVPRRAGPQHHALAVVHVPVPAVDQALRPPRSISTLAM